MKLILKLCLAVGLMAACITPATAQVGLSTRWNGTATNTASFLTAPVTVTNSTTLTIASNAVPVWRGRGMALMPTFTCAGADTGNVTFNWNLSYDGTNWTTTTPISLVLVANGTTRVTGYTNVPADKLDNVRFIRLATISGTATTVATVSNVVWSAFP